MLFDFFIGLSEVGVMVVIYLKLVDDLLVDVV